MTYSIIKKLQLEGAQRIDAEYYQPEYLDLIRKLNAIKAVPVKSVATNPKRNFIRKTQDPFRYIEISEINLSTGEYTPKSITDAKTPDRAQWIVKNGDVIISTVRPVRNAVSLIGQKDENLVCSSGFAVLSTNKIEPEYLFAYFKSRPIVELLDRQTTATMYPAVTIDDVLNIRIYLGSQKFRSEIKSLVIESRKRLGESKQYYQQAEDLLLEELGLKDFKAEEKNYSVVNLSDIQKANRIDAEYFLPKYNDLISKIKTRVQSNDWQKSKKLGEIVSMTKGFEPGGEAYQEEGKPFIRVSNISKDGIINGDQKYINEELYQKLKENYQPKIGEILLTKDATPGIAFALENEIEGIISSGILRLKVDKEVDAQYLALVMNSIVGKMQAERDAGGSIIAHWKPEQIKNMLTPILPKPTQQKIANLVRKSHSARQKSKELLNEAKRKVEEIIEKGER